jgi:ComF family protein
MERTSRLRSSLALLGSGALHWAFPDACRNCEAPLGFSPTLCPSCWRGIQTWGRMQDGVLDPASPMATRAATRYKGAAREAILAMKLEARPRLSRRLAHLIADIAPALYDWSEYGALIPIPSHRVRRAERGFSQTELLAKWLGSRVGLPVQSNWLRRVKATKPLSRLEGPAARRIEVQGAFRCARIPDTWGDRPALLLDDIVTTGATTAEAARVLGEAGMTRVDVVCVARTVPDPPVLDDLNYPGGADDASPNVIP